jgi:diguanylate cyclase (GGDEF)-like protein
MDEDQNTEMSAEAVVSLRDLTRFLNALPAPFVVYDVDERIIVCNAAYQREYHPLEHRVVPGISHSELQMLKIEHGLDSDAIGREEEFLKTEQLRHRQGPAIEEWEDDTGQFKRMLRTRLPDGSVVGMRFDITDLRLAERELKDRNERLKDTQRMLASAAMVDDLTQLANRRAAHAALEDIAARSSDENLHVGVVLYDLDGFKQINDSFGHAAGDTLLREVAARMTQFFGPEMLVARMGGDEFLVILTSGQDGYPFEDVVLKSIRHICHPALINDCELHFGLSAGIAVDCSSDIAPDKRLAMADTALYSAKEQSGNSVRQFDEQLRQKTQFDAQLRHDILSGALADQLVLYFQPIVDAANPARVPSAETLVRWDHPQFGLLSPDKFLPIVESVRAARKLDEIVLDRTLAQIAKWQNEGFTVPKISVNISPQRLLDEKLLESLTERALPPDAVSFEILETVFSDRCNTTLQWNLDGLHDAGIELQIDDYGTSHSSISSLLMIRPSRIKIDRQFCGKVAESKEARDIVRLTVALAKSLGISVTAEGVENAETAERLAALGCDRLQGYLFGKPCPAGAFQHMLHHLRTAKTA